VTLPSQSGEPSLSEDVSRGGVTVSEPSAVPGPAEPDPEVVVIDSGFDETAEAEPAQPEPVAKPARVRKPVPRSVAIYGAALSILAAMLLGFAAELSFVGAIEHNRAQRLGYAQLRLELANGVAPIGPADGNGVLVAQGAPVALLKIPAIDVTEVVFQGTTSRVLEKGPGHDRLTPMPGQAGISWLMGRKAAYGGPFGDLGKLRPKDLITVTTGQGVSTFSVLDVRRAGDPQPPAPAAGAGRLQLITASGGSYQPDGVLRVDADLTSKVLGTPAAVSGVPPLANAERPLQGDPSILLVLVLWSQALLVAVGFVVWARVRWGRWQAWIVGVPLLTTLGLAVAGRAAELLPNLM
jgi:sortase A